MKKSVLIVIVLGMLAGTLGAEPPGTESGLQITGALETELSLVDADDPAQDIVLAASEISLEAVINPRVTAELLLLWEEDDTPEVIVEEGIIRVELEHGISLKTGRSFLPFGVFDSLMVSDPLTLELGETGETLAALVYEHEFVQAELALYNGELTIDNGDEHIEGYALGIGYTPLEGFQLGISFCSNLAESDGLEGTFAGNIEEAVPGIALFVSYEINGFTVLAEYVQAGAFNDADLDEDGDGEGDAPSALNLELWYFIRSELAAGLRYGVTRECADMPETVIAAGLNWEMYEQTSLAVEYQSYTYDDDFTTLDDAESIVTIQLAIEF